MITLVPKPLTSNNGANGLFPRSAFKYDAQKNEYRCPANQALTYRHSSMEKGMSIDTYYVSVPICRACEQKSQCTVGVNRRMRRWEHENVLEKMQDHLTQMPEAMTTRASTVEHPFGTIKLWTGSRHFLMQRLKNVRTEMSLNVLAYNLRRMISILGVLELINVLRAIVVYVFSALLRRFKPLRSLLLCSPPLMRIAKGAAREHLSTIWWILQG